MNLLLITTKDSGKITRSLLAFETENEAVSRLYSELAYATASGSGIVKIVAEIITDEGNVKKCERWAEEVKTESAPSKGVSE